MYAVRARLLARWLCVALGLLLCVGGCANEPPAEGGRGFAGPACVLPPRECDPRVTDCDELVPFTPREGPGYAVFIGLEPTEEVRQVGFIRRDLMMLVQYATAKVACKAGGWTYGNGGPVSLGNMSEPDGAIPHTAEGEPRHPSGTHEEGRDIDVAYYQVGTPDN